MQKHALLQAVKAELCLFPFPLYCQASGCLFHWIAQAVGTPPDSCGTATTAATASLHHEDGAEQALNPSVLAPVEDARSLESLNKAKSLQLEVGLQGLD